MATLEPVAKRSARQAEAASRLCSAAARACAGSPAYGRTGQVLTQPAAVHPAVKMHQPLSGLTKDPACCVLRVMRCDNSVDAAISKPAKLVLPGSTLSAFR